MIKNLSLFIPRINHAYRLNKSYLDIYVNKHILVILNLFLVRGIIHSLTKISGNRYRIYLKVAVDNGLVRTDIVKNCDYFYEYKVKYVKKPCRSITFVKNMYKFRYCTVEELKRYFYSHHIMHIVSTTQGLLFIDEAISRNLGGKIIISIQF